MLRYANEISSKLGYFPVEISMPILGELQAYNFAVLFLGLLFKIVISLFIAIIVLLIYSLLSVSVD